MNQIFEQNISWDRIGDHEKEDYAYSVVKATVSKDRRILTVEMELNFIIPYFDLEPLRQEIGLLAPGIEEVRFSFCYKDLILSETEVIKLYTPYVVYEVAGNPDAIKTALKNKFQISYEAFAEFEKKKEEAKKQKKQSLRKRKTVSFGHVRGEASNIDDITKDSGAVVVEGELFKKEQRPVKNGRKLVTLFITDKSTSICIKSFSTEKEWKEIDKKFNVGDTVRVQGDAEWDKFEDTVTISLNAIEKGTRNARGDKSSEQRVELHAHTKMSAMDGLIETEDLIKLAASWNHRAVAITDHGVVQAFPDAAKAVKSNNLDIKVIYGVEGYYFDDAEYTKDDGTIDYKSPDTYHIIILARTQEGLQNLYRLISISHLEYFYRRPRIPRSVLSAHRAGLIIGAACEAGEVYRAVLSKQSDEGMEKIIKFYDYLEIQPLANNRFMIGNGTVSGEDELKEINKKIVSLGEKYGKPTCATCDAHYIEPGDALYRQILQAGQKYKDAEGNSGLYVRTTEEMLEEFSYLGEEKARETVIRAPGAIADMIEDIRPVPAGKFPPAIENADEILRNKCMERAWEVYGDPLPEDISKRLLSELNSIISNGFAVMYVSAERLVRKSLDDGYLVGSRGSVGSSFAATMAGITEVNPLAAHYICPACKHFEWGDREKYECGADMDEKFCPVCGTKLSQDGFTIPFETFLGFEGDKVPDIDLNFAGEYQTSALKYVEEIFGRENVFRAGTIGKIQGKTTYGFVMKYLEEREIKLNKWEIDRLTICCSGVRRTTGQHPGGMIIVPEGHEIYEFCPIQRPANAAETDIITTHFDYHAIEDNLFKLDVLGHDAPSMLRHLQDLTGVNPLSLPLKDAKVSSIFNGIEGLDLKDPEYRFVHGTFGIPEFGTRFVRQMLDDTKPEKFDDLVKISGFSHGTNVWVGNARDYLKSGAATMDDIISTRDDIMSYLISKGLPNKAAFNIMESVRRGNGVSDEEAYLMRQKGVPEWYIESCGKIKYMFPRAHAVAYVMMSYRIAHFKVYHPIEFYAVYFTEKVKDFDAETILAGPDKILGKIDEVETKGKDASPKEGEEVIVLEVAYEMYARGFRFLPARVDSSDVLKFRVYDEKVLLPLCALTGVGDKAAKAIAGERDKRPFASIHEFKERTRVNKTAIEAMKGHGAFDGIPELPESDQLSFFEN